MRGRGGGSCGVERRGGFWQRELRDGQEAEEGEEGEEEVLDEAKEGEEGEGEEEKGEDVLATVVDDWEGSKRGM